MGSLTFFRNPAISQFSIAAIFFYYYLQKVENCKIVQINSFNSSNFQLNYSIRYK